MPTLLPSVSYSQFPGGVDSPAAVSGFYSCHGTPDHNVTANPGAICVDLDSGTIYAKETGTGKTGWVAAGAGGVDSVVAGTGGISVDDADPANPVVSFAAAAPTTFIVNSTGTVEDFTHAGLAPECVIFWNANGGDANIGGINAAGFADGQGFWLFGKGTSAGTVNLIEASGGSNPVNQFRTGGNLRVDRGISNPTYGGVRIVYDATLQKWRPVVTAFV